MKQPARRVRVRIAVAASLPLIALACSSNSSDNGPDSVSRGGSMGSGSVTSAGSQSGSATGSVSASNSGGSSGASGSNQATSKESTSASSSTSADASSEACTVGTMPSGGATHTGTSLGGTADGLSWSLWSNGSGGSITTFTNATAYGASWSNGGDFLANLGMNFNSTQSYTSYGTITAQFAESRTGTAGGFSFIGMYGWMRNPCVEYYIVDDSFNHMPTKTSTTTATIDGATYYLTSNTTTGTGGNNCGSSVTQWTQMWSVRATGRQCGQISVTDHFNAWKAQGWALGNLTSVLVNVEVGGGTGSISFPVASVTATP